MMDVKGHIAFFVVGVLVGCCATFIGMTWPQAADVAALVFACIALVVVAVLVVSRILYLRQKSAFQKSNQSSLPDSNLSTIENTETELQTQKLNDFLKDNETESNAEIENKPSFSALIYEMAIAYQLTPREKEVFELLLRGRDAKHMSDYLVVSINTVRTHIQNVYNKLDVHSREELIDCVETFAKTLR